MAGRYIDIIVRVNSKQFERAMKKMGAEADTAAAQTDRAFRRSQAAIEKTGTAMQSVGKVMVGTGLVMGAVGYASVKSAVTFQQSMTRIQTQAGGTKGQVDALSKAVLDLGASGQVQYGPTQLANALFHIESVSTGAYKGLRNTSTAMMALKVAAQGAAVGGSDLEQTTTALMGALFATREPLSKLPEMMSLLNATVGAGNMRMDDLVGALGRGLIPAFQQVGLKAKDAFAAIALLSDSGVKASSGAAQLSTALHFLVQPSAKADKFLTAINMTQTQMAADLHQPHGLITALSDLANHMKTLPGGLTGIDAGQVMSALFPGGRGRVLLTLIQNIDRYKGKLDAVYGSTKKQNEAVKAQQQTMSGKLHTAWAQIQTDMTRFGATLVPLVAKYLPQFTHAIQSIFGWMIRLSPATKRFLFVLTGGFLVGGTAIWGIGKIVTVYGRLRGALVAIRTAGAAAFAGESLAAAGINLLVASLRKFAPFAAIYFALGAAHKLDHLAKQGGHTGSKAIQGAILGGSAGVFGAVGAGALLGTPAGPPGMLLGAGVGGLVGAGMAVFNAFHGAQGGLVTPRGIRHMAMGGPVGSDNVPAWLSAGEGVVSRVGMAGLGTRGLGALNSGMFPGQFVIESAPVNIYLDGRVLARAVLQQTLRKAARGPSGLVGGQLTTGAPSLGR